MLPWDTPTRWLLSFTLLMWIVGLGSHIQDNMVVFCGFTIPELCIYRVLWDMECFGCGLTRSVVLSTHFQFEQAVKMHFLGPWILGIHTLLSIKWTIAQRKTAES